MIDSYMCVYLHAKLITSYRFHYVLKLRHSRLLSGMRVIALA